MNEKPWSLPLVWDSEFHHLHRFIVVGVRHRRAVQGAYSQQAAARACKVLNEHNAKYGHEERFEVLPIPQRLHNQEPSTWDLDPGRTGAARESHGTTPRGQRRKS